MLKIRLTRLGKKNKSFFRVVVAEHTSPIKGRFVEALGFLNPHTKEKNFNKERILYWIEKGAKCSDTTHNLLVKEGIVKGPKIAVKMKKKEEKSETHEAKEEKKEGKSEKKSEEPIEEKKPARNAAHSAAGGETAEENKEGEKEKKAE